MVMRLQGNEVQITLYSMHYDVNKSENMNLRSVVEINSRYLYRKFLLSLGLSYLFKFSSSLIFYSL